MYITQGLHRHLQQQPDVVAIRAPGRNLTFAELEQRVARLAGAFKALGIGSGERVAMLSLNSHRYIEYYLAVPWADAVLNPVNSRWSVAEILYALDDSQTSLLIVDETFKAMGAQLIERASTVRQVIYAGDGGTPPGMLSYETLLAAAEPVQDARRHGDALAGIFYTGGTTGAPKGVMLSHNNLASSALATLSAGEYAARTVYLHVMPMFHVAGFAALNALLISGGTHILLPSFVPQAVLETIYRERVTQLLLAPTMLQMLLKWCDDNPQAAALLDLSSIERITYGASPITPALLDRACRMFQAASFTQGYGMTELSPMATVLTQEMHREAGRAKGRHRSGGRAAIGCEVRIVGPDHKPVATGEVGEVAVRGDNVMMGYWERPEETAKAVIDGWMHTGDGGYMDEEGYVYLVDRMKDMIISGGENVYSIEVENVVAQHPAVAQCAVIGIPDPQWGETVHAIVIAKAGAQLNAAELVAFCKDRIAGYKCPRSVDVRAEPFPLSGAGKVLKRELRRPFWESGAAAVQARAG